MPIVPLTEVDGAIVPLERRSAPLPHTQVRETPRKEQLSTLHTHTYRVTGARMPIAKEEAAID